MRTENLATLRELVGRAISASSISSAIKEFGFEENAGDEADFLRVNVTMKPKTKADDVEFQKLLEAIEAAVGAVDERYPSVRFQVAA